MKNFPVSLLPTVFYYSRLFTLILSIFISSNVAAQDDNSTITVQEGEQLRDIAKKYLNDENLWQFILKYNNLKSPTDVRAGSKLLVPVKLVKAADAELNNALQAIQNATKAGAKLFAPDIIQKAIQLRNDALNKRKQYDWNGSISLSKNAIETANTALKVSKEKNDVQTQAILKEKAGSVQGRTSLDLIWQETPVRASLVEGHRVRTLSQSWAEILFKDDSRLRLNANSQAVIQKMRMNIIENKQEAKVSLLEGDIYALLAGNKKKKMDVDFGDVQTKINSKNFWANKSEKKFKISNYGEEIEVVTGGKSVKLGKNQGTAVGFDNKPIESRSLLNAPIIKIPSLNSKIYRSKNNPQVRFQWSPVSGAVSYWLEVSFEKSSFENVIISEHNIPLTEYISDKLSKDGTYYCRIAAIDNNGLAGIFSEPVVFRVITDFTIPFISIYNLENKTLVKTSSIVINGEISNNTKLFIDGENIPVKNGIFSYTKKLSEGKNIINFEVVDPAGSKTLVEREVYYAPPRRVVITKDPGLLATSPNSFVTANKSFLLLGKTEKNSLITISQSEGLFTARTITDSTDGSFRFTVPLQREENEFTITLVTSLNDTASSDFKVSVVNQKPLISLKRKIPEFTTNSVLPLQGNLENTAKLFLNNEEIKITKNEFNTTVNLTQGRNLIILRAESSTGLISEYVYEIVFDNEPPTLQKVEVLPRIAAGGDILTISAQSADFSPLRKTASYKLMVGQREFTGYCSLQRAQNNYIGFINLPVDVSGKVTLLSITFSDVYGNEKTYNIGK